MYECPYCEFRSMNKKALEQHIQEKHKDKVKAKAKEQKKESSKEKGSADYLTALKDSKIEVKVKMLTGEVFIGRITDVSTYLFILETKDGLIYIYKHGVAYITPV